MRARDHRSSQHILERRAQLDLAPPVQPLILHKIREMLSSIRDEIGLDGSALRKDHFVRGKWPGER